MDKRYHESFAPAFRLKVGPKGKQICSGFFAHAQGMSYRGPRKAGVGINKKEKIPPGLPGQLLAGPRFSRPSPGQIRSRQKSDSGILMSRQPDNLRSVIG